MVSFQCMCTVCPWKPEEGVRSRRSGVAESRELPWVWIKPRSLQGQQELLTAELSLQLTALQCEECNTATKLED